MRVTSLRILGNFGLFLCIALSVNVLSVKCAVIQFQSSSITASEGDGSINVNICINPPVAVASDIAFNLTILSQTPVDDITVPPTGIIRSGNTCGTITIGITDDTVEEDAETFLVLLTSDTSDATTDSTLNVLTVNVEDNENPCTSNPCQGGGTCNPFAQTTGILTYMCDCPQGRTGVNCENAAGNVCVNNPCQGGSTCTVVSGRGQCTCPPGRTGFFCETLTETRTTQVPRTTPTTTGHFAELSTSPKTESTASGGSPPVTVYVIVVIVIVIVVCLIIAAVFYIRFRKTHKKEDRNMGSDITYANKGFVQGSSSVSSKSKGRDALSYETVETPKGKDTLSYETVGNPGLLKDPMYQTEHLNKQTRKQPREKVLNTEYEETSFSGTSKVNQEGDATDERVIYEGMPEDSNNYDKAVYRTDEAPLPFKVSELPNYVNKKKFQKNGLEREFKLLPQGQQHPWTIATKAENNHKNHVPNMLPYDHSRVKMTKLPGKPSSDYYNASFIMDQQNRHAFIAAQGPYKNTVQEFLRLIWQGKVSIIIMVTPLEESGKKLCSQYWPSKVSEMALFGNMSVTLTSEEHYPDYSFRQLKINPEGKSAVNVLQLHFPSWPYNGVPKKPMSLIRFIRYIKEALQERHLPVLVHCSDGSGATGTLIGAFCLMDELEENDEISIYEFVKKMRKNRVNMVQTKGQYIFIYDVLLQAYLLPNSKMSAKDLKNMTIRKNSFSKEFQALRTPEYNITAQSGASPENHGKNRFENVIPLDVYRPKLECSSLTGGNDYINACFVNGYRDKNAIVMTQSPLPTTEEDFWRLVVDLQCSTIVMLNETDSSDSKSCVCYWPNGGNVQYGNILVTCVNIQDEDTYVHRQFNVTHQSQKADVSVDHFQLRIWPQKNITVWKDFIRTIRFGARAGPIVVHCVDGCGHSGVFVTVLNELQRLRQKQNVSVFETVQELRDSNPHTMQTLEDYTLCYEILQGLTDQN